jgi:1,4-alpha-glucan branching enzyme
MTKRGIAFTFCAPEAKTVHLAGNFNNWDIRSHPLHEVETNKGESMWKRIVYLEPGIYEYRFVVDGIWHDDPGSIEGWTNEFGSFSCVIWV